LSQATAYKGIRARCPPFTRHTTERNLQLARTAILSFKKVPELDGTIWKNIRKRAVRPKIQQFLSNAIHGTFMLGEFGENIPDHNHRKWCATCNETETGTMHKMHRRTSQAHLGHGERTMATPPTSWPQIDLGAILGCGSLTIATTEY
ncbi:hypothetical protein EDB86DRAFT_2816533, partial [Lactarius hatsudake]